MGVPGWHGAVGEGPGGEKAPAGASTAAAVGKQIALLREQTLLRQCGNTDSTPEGSSHYCGSEEIQKRLLRERRLLRRWGNTEKAPAGADTTAVVGKYRESSCGSGHCCGSGEKQLGGGGGGREGGGEGDGKERLLWGLEVYSKGDGRLGSGGLP